MNFKEKLKRVASVLLNPKTAVVLQVAIVVVSLARIAYSLKKKNDP